MEQKAISRDAASGLYGINYERMPAAFEKLAKELLTIEATGDRERAENWFTMYGNMPADLTAALAAGSEVPVDIDPVFSFPDTIE